MKRLIHKRTVNIISKALGVLFSFGIYIFICLIMPFTVRHTYNFHWAYLAVGLLIGFPIVLILLAYLSARISDWYGKLEE